MVRNDAENPDERRIMVHEFKRYALTSDRKHMNPDENLREEVPLTSRNMVNFARPTGT